MAWFGMGGLEEVWVQGVGVGRQYVRKVKEAEAKASMVKAAELRGSVFHIHPDIHETWVVGVMVGDNVGP